VVKKKLLPMTSEPPPARNTTCSIKALVLGDKAGDAEYQVLPGATYRLLPSQIRMVLENIRPATRVMQLPKDCLPFGLLDSIVLIGMPADAPPATLRITKTTGIAECSVEAPRWKAQVGVGNATLFTGQDAPSEDLKATREATGHIMTWRMLPGACVGDITLTFGGPPPATLHIVYLGANAVPLEEACDRRPRLLFPPMLPAQRLEGVQKVTSALLAKKS
jgi:hypothetical protein